MTIRDKLLRLAEVVAEQAARDPEFSRKLDDILENKRRVRTRPRAKADGGVRPKNRRPPAILNPVDGVREHGEEWLRCRLVDLNLEQLRDIVAEYGMDQGRQVMKWKTESRVIERIVEIALARSQKGDAFRGTSTR